MSMRTMFSMLGNFVKRIGKGNVEADHEYVGFRDVKKAKIKALKADGKGNRPFHSTYVSHEEEEKLYEAGELGFESPETLQRTMWWHTTLLFGHRGRQESRQLQWSDILLKTDENGQEYLEFSERLTKTRSGGTSADSRALAPKAFSNKNDPRHCPVETYRTFSAIVRKT